MMRKTVLSSRHLCCAMRNRLSSSLRLRNRAERIARLSQSSRHQAPCIHEGYALSGWNHNNDATAMTRRRHPLAGQPQPRHLSSFGVPVLSQAHSAPKNASACCAGFSSSAAPVPKKGGSGDTAGSSTGSTSSTNHAFDRALKRMQRDNAARRLRSNRGDDAAYDYDYFRSELAKRLVDRLEDCARPEGFPLALDVGSGPGYVYDAICDTGYEHDDNNENEEDLGGIGGVRKLVQLDSSKLQLNRNTDENNSGGAVRDARRNPCDTYRLEWDEEALPLPFPDGTFDLVTSSGSLHFVNNLPGVLKEVARVLKPDGCFLLAMVGGTSLPELRASLVLAELEREGGVSPHVGPFVQLTDVGNLLQRAGFALPTLDVDTIRVSYPHAGVLMEHLQRMGESNACLSRRNRTPLDVFLSAACLYAHSFPLEEDGPPTPRRDGDPVAEIEATVQVIYAIGWTPHPSQQQPRERGSATRKLADRVEVIQETSAV
jgi:NADH dehydrogenase [ubiquinone] 1 alpha subcomplex assembly factor 5